MSRTVKSIFYGAGLVILVALSIVTGMRIERNNQKVLEMRKETVSTIAVVNMDNGVLIGDEQTNYAS